MAGRYQRLEGTYCLYLQGRSISILTMEGICSSKTLVTTYQTGRRHNPEDGNINLHPIKKLTTIKPTYVYYV
jgi:hypothetical protein